MDTVDLIVVKISIKTNNTFRKHRQNTKSRNFQKPSTTALYSLSNILKKLNLVNILYKNSKKYLISSTTKEVLIT